MHAWAHVWQRLVEVRRDLPKDVDFDALLRCGHGWLEGREDTHEWTYVWQRLLERRGQLPVDVGDLFMCGFDWLTGRQQRNDWTHVWEKLVDNLADLPRELGPDRVLAVGRVWLGGRPEAPNSSYVVQRLIGHAAINADLFRRWLAVNRHHYRAGTFAIWAIRRACMSMTDELAAEVSALLEDRSTPMFTPKLPELSRQASKRAGADGPERAAWSRLARATQERLSRWEALRHGQDVTVRLLRFTHPRWLIELVGEGLTGLLHFAETPWWFAPPEHAEGQIHPALVLAVEVDNQDLTVSMRERWYRDLLAAERSSGVVLTTRSGGVYVGLGGFSGLIPRTGLPADDDRWPKPGQSVEVRPIEGSSASAVILEFVGSRRNPSPTDEDR